MSISTFKNTTLKNGFLFDKQELNRKITINAVWDRFYDTGRINAFKFDWKEGEDKKPHYFWDSDVAKWMESAAYTLAKHENAALKEKLEWLIDRIEENQDDNGYFNIYYTVCEPD